jgi:hypothetical protein
MTATYVKWNACAVENAIEVIQQQKLVHSSTTPLRNSVASKLAF